MLIKLCLIDLVMVKSCHVTMAIFFRIHFRIITHYGGNPFSSITKCIAEGEEYA